MAFILDAALDAGLNRACDNVENLYINSAEPATFTAASSTNRLGTKASPSIGAAQDGVSNGRRRVIAAITDGVVNTTGTATHWSLTDDSASELMVTGALSSSQGVTASNTFTTNAINITFADAVNA